MSLFKKEANPVGRPSNEMIKKRKNKKIAIAVASIIGVVLVGGGAYLLLSGTSLSDLMGNSVANRKTYTITISSNGARVSQTKVSCSKTGADCKIKLPTINRSGYEIIGFNTNPNATTSTYKSGATITINKNMKLYAITSKKVIATFNGNGATISRNNASCTIYNENTNCKITLPTITRSGYTVLGFSTNQKATTATYKAGSTIAINKNMTLYAITSKKVTATFNGNGATISSKTANCTIYNQDTNCKITLPKITRNGYIILGFSTNPNATTSTYKSGATITINKNTTLYAITKKARS